MNRPIMPDDEAFDYLSTQAIADFLATENDPPLDGITFPSAQLTDGALNFVLFHKASSVEPIELPHGTAVKAQSGWSTDEGWETDYRVVEEVPLPEKTPPKKKNFGAPNFAEIIANAGEDLWSDCETREERSDYFSLAKPTLQIDLKSVTVHLVQGVKFTTQQHAVQRSRWEKQSLDEAPF
jgi:RES domain